MTARIITLPRCAACPAIVRVPGFCASCARFWDDTLTLTRRWRKPIQECAIGMGEVLNEVGCCARCSKELGDVVTFDGLGLLVHPECDANDGRSAVA